MKAIDLGLSVMWGDCNLGASSPERSGGIYTWTDATKKKNELLIKKLELCKKHARDLTNTANVLYAKYVSGEKFAARVQCLDFKRMEIECKKFSEKKK